MSKKRLKKERTVVKEWGWVWVNGNDKGVSKQTHFCPGKFKFKLFLNDLWYEPETIWLFLNFTRDYFAEKTI